MLKILSTLLTVSSMSASLLICSPSLSQNVYKAHYFSFQDYEDNLYELIPIRKKYYAMRVNGDNSRCVGADKYYKKLVRLNCFNLTRMNHFWRVYGIFDTSSAKLELANSGLCMSKSAGIINCSSKNTIIVRLKHIPRIEIR